jgi:hypothetical protein
MSVLKFTIKIIFLMIIIKKYLTNVISADIIKKILERMIAQSALAGGAIYHEH